MLIEAADPANRDFCMDSEPFEFIFGLGASIAGFLPPEPGGGVGPGQEEPEKPTEEGCAAALKQCQEEAIDEQKKCNAERALFSAMRANSNVTCHGNELDLINGIDGIFEPPDGCTLDHLEVTTFDPGAFFCQRVFRQVAIQQCMNDFPSVTTDQSITVSAEVSLKGYGKFGFGGNVRVSTIKPGGTGYRTACAALGTKIGEQCSQTNDQCLMAAEGAQPLVGQPEGLQEIIQRIDVQRLKLAGAGIGVGEGVVRPFRGTGQRRLEIQDLYKERVTFLANWSTFLKEENISPEVQSLAQILFERAQRAVINASDDFVTLLVLVFTVDPQTGRAGSDQATNSLFRAFSEKGGEHDRRLIAGEASLMSELEILLGIERLARFRQSVWPGIRTFGFAAPMTPAQVFAPPD